MRILAIDPGERVGWAHGVIDNDGLTVKGHGITDQKQFVMTLADRFANYDVIVYERWRLAKGMALKLAGSEMMTSQLIGMIRFLGWHHPGVKLVGQYPTNMRTAEKTIPPDIRAIIDGLPAAHDERHDESALLHLHYYFWSNFE